MKNRFEEIEHTADIAIRVWGRDLPELFINAAYGLASVLADIEDVVPTVKLAVELEADDLEILLVNWLSELLFVGERDNLVFTRVDSLQIAPNGLTASVRGGLVQEQRSHIKAVTFSELQITHTNEGYETVVVFDV
jgi:SHS2 domain-containing protein